MRPQCGEEAPQIAAIRRSAEAGFRFLHLRGSDVITAIHAQRKRGDTIDTFTFQDMTEAVAARFREEAYPSGDPVW